MVTFKKVKCILSLNVGTYKCLLFRRHLCKIKAEPRSRRRQDNLDILVRIQDGVWIVMVLQFLDHLDFLIALRITDVILFLEA